MSRRFWLNLILTGIVVVLWLVLRSGRPGSVLFSASSRVERQVTLLAPPPTPVVSASAATASATLLSRLSAQGVLAIDTATKRVLWQKNSHEQYYPASTTKIITALVARDFYKLDEELTITAADLVYDNTVGWRVGETVTVADLLHSLLISSANEVGMVFANHAPGGYDAFVVAMNEKAEQLGMSQTHFANPQGFDDQRQQTTATDLALATLELLRDDYLREIVALPSQAVATKDGRTYRLTNTNHLLTRTDLPYTVKGVKTGTTSLANEALVSLLEKDGHEILLVVLSAKNRYNDTIEVANFVFDNYVWQQTTPVN